MAWAPPVIVAIPAFDVSVARQLLRDSTTNVDVQAELASLAAERGDIARVAAIMASGEAVLKQPELSPQDRQQFAVLALLLTTTAASAETFVWVGATDGKLQSSLTAKH